jgi:hypothetical protein
MSPMLMQRTQKVANLPGVNSFVTKSIGSSRGEKVANLEITLNAGRLATFGKNPCTIRGFLCLDLENGRKIAANVLQ